MGRMISVIVPIYNASNYINRCIDSILNQSYKDFELLLIDDGSKDDSLAIISQYNDSRIKIYTKNNGGPASARNHGITCTQGDYITFVDSDDYIEPNYLETLLSLLDDDVDFSMCSYINEFKDHQEVIDVIAGKYQKNGIFTRLFGAGSIAYVVCWGKLYRKELFDNIRFKNVSSAEDEYLMTDIFLKAKVINISNDHPYHYIQQDNYISTSVNKTLNGSDALYERYKKYKKNKVDKKIIRLCLEYSFNYYYEFINNPNRAKRYNGTIKRNNQLFIHLPINKMGIRNRFYLFKCLIKYIFK